MKCRSKSSMSDDVEKEISDNENASNALRQHRWEPCEFCDELFSNRYSILIHNASHIIIPLIKLKTHQCSECLYHFTSLEDLAIHISDKHKDVLTDNRTPVKIRHEHSIEEKLSEILQSIVEKQVYVKCEDELKEVFIKGNEFRNKNGIAHQLNDGIDIQTHSELKHEKDFNESNELKKKNGITLTSNTEKDSHNIRKDKYDTGKERNDTEKDEYDSHKERNETGKDEYVIDEERYDADKERYDTENDGYDVDQAFPLKEEPPSPNVFIKEQPSIMNEEKESIRHRLLFEEDLEDDLFEDLTSDFQVNLESLCEELVFDFEEPTTIISDENMNLGSESHRFNCDSNVEADNGNTMEMHNTTDLVQYSKAIHYDVLMEPAISKCRWCGKHFPNRFKLLQHEPEHLRLRKRTWQTPLCCICERYISGNYRSLRNHVENKHPERMDLEKQYKIFKCPKCRLRFHNYRRHLRNYHETFKCYECGTHFETVQLRNQHNCVNVQTACGKSTSDISRNNSSSPMSAVDVDDYTLVSHKTESAKSNLQDAESTTMQLCDMCYRFMKIYMQQRQNYEVIGEKWEMGGRQTCDKCNNKFFEVKLVRRTSVIKESVKPRIKMKHHMTNKKRLKNIQQRLKQMKR